MNGGGGYVVTAEVIEHWFTYHSPTAEQLPKYQEIRIAGKNLALTILRSSPAGPDQTTAIRKVREACMTANQAIACEVQP